MSRLLAFLELAAYPGYLEDCSRVLFDKPTRTRHRLPWTPQLVSDVERRIRTYPLLEGYRSSRDATRPGGTCRSARRAAEVGVPRGVDDGVRTQERVKLPHRSVARGRERLLVRGHELELEAPRLVLHELVLEHLPVVLEHGANGVRVEAIAVPQGHMSSTRPCTRRATGVRARTGMLRLERAATSPRG